MPKFKVLEQLHHDQTAYAPDSLVELTDEQAEALIELGVVAELPKEAKKPEDKKTDK